MTRKSEDRRSRRHDVILHAASRLFSSRGYHATSMQDIADAVGILKGSLYHHFESKEAILHRIVAEPIARLHRTVGEIAESRGPAAPKLERAAAAHVQAFHDHYPHLFVYLRETESVRQRLGDTDALGPRDYERLWVDIVRDGMKAGELRADLDPTVVVYGMLGMLNWLYKWYDPNGRLGPREIATQFSALALSGLAAGHETAPAPAARRVLRRSTR
jgi:TetR/AcrR family transcriptional regulator, cholesterol catabolism regulator